MALIAKVELLLAVTDVAGWDGLSTQTVHQPSLGNKKCRSYLRKLSRKVEGPAIAIKMLWMRFQMTRGQTYTKI